MDEIIDMICMEIAESFCESAVDQMWGSVVNAGQESLVSSIEGDFLDQVEGISEGEFDPIDAPHPDAIGEMVETANSICQAGAEMCHQIRETASVVDFFT